MGVLNDSDMYRIMRMIKSMIAEAAQTGGGGGGSLDIEYLTLEEYVVKKNNGEVVDGKIYAAVDEDAF